MSFFVLSEQLGRLAPRFLRPWSKRSTQSIILGTGSIFNRESGSSGQGQKCVVSLGFFCESKNGNCHRENLTTSYQIIVFSSAIYSCLAHHEWRIKTPSYTSIFVFYMNEKTRRDSRLFCLLSQRKNFRRRREMRYIEMSYGKFGPVH